MPSSRHAQPRLLRRSGVPSEREQVPLAAIEALRRGAQSHRPGRSLRTSWRVRRRGRVSVESFVAWRSREVLVAGGHGVDDELDPVVVGDTDLQDRQVCLTARRHATAIRGTEFANGLLTEFPRTSRLHPSPAQGDVARRRGWTGTASGLVFLFAWSFGAAWWLSGAAVVADTELGVDLMFDGVVWGGC